MATIGGFLALTGFIGYGMIVVWQVELTYHSALLGGEKLQAAGFIAHIGLSMEIVTYGLLLIGSIPVALALLKFRDEEESVRGREEPATAPLS